MSPLPPAANGKISLVSGPDCASALPAARKGERAGASCDEFTAVHRDPLIQPDHARVVRYFCRSSTDANLTLPCGSSASIEPSMNSV